MDPFLSQERIYWKGFVFNISDLFFSYHNFLWNEFFAINGDWLPYYENKEKKVKNSRESVQNMFKYLSKCRDFDSF